MTDMVDISLFLRLTHEVTSMYSELVSLREEVEELRGYKQKYEDLLLASINHNQAMVSNTLKLLMTPGVVDDLIKHNTETF